MMVNKRMEEKIRTGECIDVSKCVRKAINDPKTGYPIDWDYILERFVDDVDYCDAEKERWIWSIGKHKQTGEIVASTTPLYYQHPDYECLFLR